MTAPPEDVLRLVGEGRRLGGVIVSGHHQHASVPGAAGSVGVAEDVAATIDSRPPAVPEGQTHRRVWHRERVRLAGCPTRRWRGIFVDSGLEDDGVGGGCPSPCPGRGRARQRLPGIRNEARGVEACLLVPHALQHGRRTRAWVPVR